MAAGIIYRIQFTNVEGKFVKADILDNQVQADSPVVIELEGGDAPISLSCIDNAEGKFTPIRSQQCTIQFLSTSTYGVRTFGSGPDNRFTVIVLYDTSIVFEGFLSLDDNKDLFIDGRNIVELTANDKLASLRDVRTVGFDGDVPKGFYTLAQMVALCLNLTGTPRQLRIVNSLKHGTGVRNNTNILFVSADNSITVDFNISYFYPGQVIQITDSVSNNITTRVLSIESSTKIIVEDDLVDESATIYNITFTDLSSEAHFFQHSVDALSFESDINELIDPYTILTRILGNMHELFYMDFAWWIVRKSEKRLTTLEVAKYSIEGEFDSYENFTFPKAFGFDEVHWFADERTTINTVRPLGFAKLTYRYQTPKEIICNIDFSRGEETQAPNMGAANSQGRYTPECWELHRYAGGSPTATMYIQKNFEYGYEKSRYLTITPASASSETTWAQPVNPFKIKKGDRADINVEYSAEQNFGSGEGAVEYDIVFIWIIDRNGEYWYWTDLDIGGSPKGFYSWEGPFVAEQNRPVSATWVLDTTDETDPQTLNVNLTAAPIDGDLYIGLPQFNQTGSGFDDNVTIRYNLSFNYYPLVNGSYQTFSGESHTITQPNPGYNSKYDKEAFIADALRENMKGALFSEISSSYYLTSRWHEPSDSLFVRPLLWWAAFDIWNQYRNSPTVLEFVAAGVGMIWPHIIHHIAVTDIDALTTGRLFEIITFEKDLRRCSITGTMPELYRDGYDYSDPYAFKYITN